MILDSGNLTFVFSKGSNSVSDLEFVNQGNNVMPYICSMRVYKPSEITLFGVCVRWGEITQCVCSKRSNYTFPLGFSIFRFVAFRFAF